MKKVINGVILALLISLLGVSSVAAGDCTARSKVEKEGTIKSAVHVRTDCPTGDVVGTVPAGEVVKILEVDAHNEFYLVETSVGTGFVFGSFLSDIKDTAPAPVYSDSIFVDLSTEHKYYDEISYVKAKGIVGGNPDGTIQADAAINRAALAKILVEAIADDEEIAGAVLEAGVYSDVIPGEWYVKYLQLARVYGFMSGDAGKTTVRPAENANGGEVAKMIAVAFGLEVEGETTGEFWYKPYMDSINKIVSLPYSKASHIVTRGEMMYIVAKVHLSVNASVSEAE